LLFIDRLSCDLEDTCFPTLYADFKWIISGATIFAETGQIFLKNSQNLAEKIVGLTINKIPLRRCSRGTARVHLQYIQCAG